MVQDDFNAEPVDLISLGRNDKAVGKRKQWKTAVPFQTTKATISAGRKMSVKLAAGGGFVAKLMRDKK